jgi:hypothetical protein
MDRKATNYTISPVNYPNYNLLTDYYSNSVSSNIEHQTSNFPYRQLNTNQNQNYDRFNHKFNPNKNYEYDESINTRE